ncbi:DMT family transporter [Lichenifustis flavocetrariae]|uniref:DMT family transporter n=1 Tax=Lichenifustis flavocetrariae TaxID=2949735 RepID=A0AA41YQR4_9HYPH|nr:DMT family transporter [Lichenifustis flavocetrariae]MCW6506824.1 DMT family transporter [Lichenifustis flavocetrariae]
MLLFSTLAVMAGMLFPSQTAINAKLAAGVGGPVVATTISFVAGLASLIVLLAITTRGAPDWAAIRQTPPWLLCAGGFLGAIYLSLNVFLVPRIGAGAMMALAIAGQMLAALTIDSAGLFGVAHHTISVGRAAGAVVVLLGALMVRFL